jgi:NAD(P)-dependent dehydrogenase (short-subunit alcohol dehydrogenase family)
MTMKSVLITGTSSGIGEAAAQYFLKRRGYVYAADRYPEKLGVWSHTEQVVPVSPRCRLAVIHTPRLERAWRCVKPQQTN